MVATVVCVDCLTGTTDHTVQQQKLILSRFWRLQVQPRWCRLGSSEGLCRDNRLMLPSFGQLLALCVLPGRQKLCPKVCVFTQRSSCVSVSFCPDSPFL